MMKKLTHITVALLLLISTSGVALSSHYCMGRLKSVSLSITENSCCADNSGNCCHNAVKVYKVSTDFSSYEIPADFNAYTVAIVTLYVEFVDQLSHELISYYIDSISPPKVGDFLAIIQKYIL